MLKLMKKVRCRSLFVMLLVSCLFIGIIPVYPVSTIVLANEKEFVVGFDAEFPPYGYKDENGEYVGFDLDLAEEVCKRNGWKLKKQPIDWDSKDMELSTGAIDCIWNGFTMNGREDLYTWSVPYVDNSQVVIVKKNSHINKLSDLAGKVVAVQADSSALAAFTGDDASKENKALAKSFEQLQEVPDYNSAFMNLDVGAVDAICLDIGVASYEIAVRDDKFVMLEEQVSTEQYGIGFNLGNTEARDKVQETLFEMLDDGTFLSIAKEWNLQDCVCLSKDNSAQKSSKIVLEDNEFTVGFDAEFPPYGYKNEDGEYVGFDLDLAAEVCKRNGWKLKKQPIDWDSKDMELSTGAIDCIWNGFTMNGREELYTWSVPYVDNSQVVIVKKNSDIKKLSDLAGKVVAVQADSSALAAFTGDDASEENKALAKSFTELQEVPDYNSAFMNLEVGAVDAICLDIGVASYEIAVRDDKFAMLEEQVSTEQYGVGFNLGNTQLRDVVQNTLFEMLEDGTFEAIAKEWDLQDCICLSKDAVIENTLEPIQSADATQPVISDKTSNDEQQEESDVPTKYKKGKQKKDLKWAWNVTKQLGEGLSATLAIFFLTLIFSLPLGLFIAFGRMSKFKPLQVIAKFYISIMRGTPLMLQLIAVFYGPSIILNWNQPRNYRFIAIIIGFVLNYAAYFAEIYRSGIQGVPKGQYEAAHVLGYSRVQTFWKIVFPQMCKRVIPPVTNEIITLVKDTSLAFALAYTEMFKVAKTIVAAQATILPLFIAGAFYYFFNLLVAFIMERIEKKLDYY